MKNELELFLNSPTPKEQKNVTSRIITKEDIERILRTITLAQKEGETGHDLAFDFTALALFAAYTGQRTEATIKKLTVTQFRLALNTEKPVIDIQVTRQDQDATLLSAASTSRPSNRTFVKWPIRR